MIQRIQSLLLLAVAGISAALFFVPLSEKAGAADATGISSINTLNINEVTSKVGDTFTSLSTNYGIMVLNLLILTAALYTIFLYKNRPAQMRMCMLAGVFAAIELILVFYYSEEMEVKTARAHYLAGVYLIAVQVFLLLASRRAIRKDEMLVRAADRIR